MRTCPECGYGALVATDTAGELGCTRCEFTCAAPRPIPDGLEKARQRIADAKAKLAQPDGPGDAA